MFTPMLKVICFTVESHSLVHGLLRLNLQFLASTEMAVDGLEFLGKGMEAFLLGDAAQVVDINGP